MTTRQQTFDEYIATIIQRGFVAQKTSWEIMEDVRDAYEKEAEVRAHDPRSEL